MAKLGFIKREYNRNFPRSKIRAGMNNIRIVNNQFCPRSQVLCTVYHR